jgi:hypothetical protein
VKLKAEAVEIYAGAHETAEAALANKIGQGIGQISDNQDYGVRCGFEKVIALNRFEGAVNRARFSFPTDCNRFEPVRIRGG